MPSPKPRRKPEKAPGKPDGSSGAEQTNRRRGGQPENGNAIGHGAPRGNRNALKHGIWSKLVGNALVEEALALGELDPAERARMHRLIREARLLRAARQKDTPVSALDRAWGSVLADIDPDAMELGGESEDLGVVVLDGTSEDWLDG